MSLFDMGAEYFCYGSDVTCSFPISSSRKFTSRQRAVYEGVLNAQRRVITMLEPGVSWVDCHKAAEAEILKALIGLDVVVPGSHSVDHLVEIRLGAVFMPHGLGHLIGIDTHDVGGYLPGHQDRIQQPGLRSLRTSRDLKEGMTITVEPGCYFIDHLIDEAIKEGSEHAPFLNLNVLDEFRGFGGVRLEDVLEITTFGCENYTLCPRTVDEVESVMANKKWPPMTDDDPSLKRTRLTASSPMSFSTPI
jgi:Xaa-Pro dipeptidase